ncbi:hypothetical protein ACFW5W_05145 [Streptomyces sp. NPDC058783]|uniref:hypothetical protein n=1 Tax=unclassified Streptomyces TaxID=2593676 RepID=UPI00365795C8
MFEVQRDLIRRHLVLIEPGRLDPSIGGRHRQGVAQKAPPAAMRHIEAKLLPLTVK